MPQGQESFGSLPTSARLYVVVVLLAGLAVLGQALPHATPDRPILFLVLLVLSAASSTVKLPLPLSHGGSTLSLSYPISFASLLLLGAPATVPIAMVSAWTQCNFRIAHRNPLYRTLFGMACLAITVAGTGLVANVVRSAFPGPWALVHVVVPATVAYFLLNTALVSIAVALSTRDSLLKVWRENFLWSAPSYFVGSAAAALVTIVIQEQAYWGGLFAVAPLYLVYRSYEAFIARIEKEQRSVREMSAVQLATIEALAMAIEAKDRTSRDHIRRIQIHADGLARAIGMDESDVRGVKTAALLQDIGNLAVPEHILAKPSALTWEEFQKVKTHPRVGADIVQAVPFPYPVAPLVLAHHEHWDGSGYPSGVAGTEIPLGARVLAVVDSFAAMVVDRPYRPALPFVDAVKLLREGSGTSFDPKVVDVFLTILPDLELRLNGSAPAFAPFGAALDATLPTKALQDIAGAHHEGQALYDIAQGIGASLTVADTMALISSKLQQLIPFSGCAVFLRNEATSLFQCRHVTGAYEEAVRRIQAHTLGEIESTWLANEAGSHGTSVPGSTLASALEHDGRVVGALVVYAGGEEPHSPDHRRLLDRVARQAGPVLFNAVRFEQIQEESVTDPVTGLPNRRYMTMHLTRDLARAGREGRDVAVLVMDVDRFKDVNDSFGHEAGDRALREIGQVIRASLRPYDLFARYAGDEFTIALWECDAEHAERRRQDLKQLVSEIRFEAGTGIVWPLSISVGVAMFPSDGWTQAELLAVADRRMYADKAAGRATDRHENTARQSSAAV